jgi:6-phosphofructokinase 1
MAAFVVHLGLSSSMRSRVAILTSGGDAPGMNAAIAEVCDAMETRGGSVLGVRWGFAGLARSDVAVIHAHEARRHAAHAGTWLGTSRWPALRDDPECSAICTRVLAAHRASGLIVLGGNGSMLGARRLSEAFSPVVFIPCTIDDDIPGTAASIGTDSAVSYAAEVIDRLLCTGRSLPGRGFLVQTLGAPHRRLTHAVAAAAGVEEVISPEPHHLERVAERLAELAPAGGAIAVMSESVGDGVTVAAELARRSGVRVHPTVLGHAQRAATLTARDRRLATHAARAAVEQLTKAQSGFITLNADGATAATSLCLERTYAKPR